MKVKYASLGYFGVQVEILYTDGIFHVLEEWQGLVGSYTDEKEACSVIADLCGCQDDKAFCESIEGIVADVSQFPKEV